MPLIIRSILSKIPSEVLAPCDLVLSQFDTIIGFPFHEKWGAIAVIETDPENFT